MRLSDLSSSHQSPGRREASFFACNYSFFQILVSLSKLWQIAYITKDRNNTWLKWITCSASSLPLVVLLEEIFFFFTIVVQASFAFYEVLVAPSNLDLPWFEGFECSMFSSSSTWSAQLALGQGLIGNSTSRSGSGGKADSSFWGVF